MCEFVRGHTLEFLAIHQLQDAGGVRDEAVLRVAAETIERSHQDVVYFPSYEIITGSYSRGRYFAEDLRSVTEEGVAHVMRVFMERFTRKNRVRNALSPTRDKAAALDRELEALSDLACEEALLANRE